MQSEHLRHTIDPVFDARSRVLMLGSFPSPKSREVGFFYGHPQNRMWRVLTAVTGESAVPRTTEERTAFLLRNRIAMWDVIASCTIECASDTTAPYAFKDVVYQKLITLCIDICKRNGKKKLLWLGDKDKTLNYSPAADEMVLTVHRWFANKSCPGDWMYARMGDLASKVTAALGGAATTPKQLYRVRKTWSDSKSQKGAYKILANAKACADKNPGYSVFDTDGNAVYTSKTDSAGVPGDATFKVRVSVPDLNIRSGPGTNYAATGRFTGAGVFTITAVQSGQGSITGWGKLKSGAGWIALDYAKRV